MCENKQMQITVFQQKSSSAALCPMWAKICASNILDDSEGLFEWIFAVKTMHVMKRLNEYQPGAGVTIIILIVSLNQRSSCILYIITGYLYTLADYSSVAVIGELEVQSAPHKF
ncbi:hypothetical protein CEXT_759601 [Caerostris extrusa]|uniref:Uncharacterized protein n=1 Tax=Caerostris extrusa TaxID=172846 RepID=A0AAV4NZ71_CAEEX|nr:hypothetical protein CEXT_759601 [Caerostris extrusa]